MNRFKFLKKIFEENFVEKSFCQKIHVFFFGFLAFLGALQQKHAENGSKRLKKTGGGETWIFLEMFFDKIFLKKLFQKFKSIHMDLNSFQKKIYPG